MTGVGHNLLKNGWGRYRRNKTRSTFDCITNDIPHRSPFGITLFLAFINVLAQFITKGLVVLSADNTNVAVYAQNYKDLDGKITYTYKQLSEWYSANEYIT